MKKEPPPSSEPVLIDPEDPIFEAFSKISLKQLMEKIPPTKALPPATGSPEPKPNTGAKPKTFRTRR